MAATSVSSGLGAPFETASSESPRRQRPGCLAAKPGVSLRTPRTAAHQGIEGQVVGDFQCAADEEWDSERGRLDCKARQRRAHRLGNASHRPGDSEGYSAIAGWNDRDYVRLTSRHVHLRN